MFRSFKGKKGKPWGMGLKEPVKQAVLNCPTEEVKGMWGLGNGSERDRTESRR